MKEILGTEVQIEFYMFILEVWRRIHHLNGMLMFETMNNKPTDAIYWRYFWRRFQMKDEHLRCVSLKTSFEWRSWRLLQICTEELNLCATDTRRGGLMETWIVVEDKPKNEEDFRCWSPKWPILCLILMSEEEFTI